MIVSTDPNFVRCTNDDDCCACTGECCAYCGAGCWSDVTDCKHDIFLRHTEPPDPSPLDELLKG